MNPEFQKQHQISRVYLKQFGHIDENGCNWVSVYKVGSGKTHDEKVDEFTTQTNIFDLPFEDPEIKRHFENLSGQLESRYNSVINSLTSHKKLTPESKDILNYFVANLLCRTNRFRDFIKHTLNDEQGRNVLLREITMFSDDNQIEELELILSQIPTDNELNIVMCYVMNHLVYVFQRFKKVVLKHYKNLGWLTSDNPVHIEKFDNFSWIIPIESEIYFPLSKDFCLFMFNPNSENQENKLRTLKLDKVNIVDFETCDRVNKKMFFDNKAYLNFDYLIFNTKVEQTMFEK